MLLNSQIGCRIRSRGGIRSTVSQCPGNEDYQVDPLGVRASSITYTCPCRYTTSVEIVNNTIKCQRSRAIGMRYFWLLNQKNNRYFKVWYKPGAENMGDYPSKANTGAIHHHVRPHYLQMPISPRTLLRADKPSSR